ncbi:hypothetical protein B0I35DRAFT_482550 [Stachybotrys elegans]|uniref:SET domain-containing protein n=1 Tax=Stachybotrys elegans TaxID=80388 RepID=A0A8K0WMP9_9HYPO|nr:hypothetical protein B0I35DRAFT_482550 [Stachybotrys elegans]
MEDIEHLLEWAQTEGVTLDGITPNYLTGRGIGLVAKRQLKPDEVVLKVPLKHLRTLGNTPSEITKALHGASVHAILAVSLCLETSPHFDAWRAVLPSRQDLTSSMPICWPEPLQKLLPPTAQALLAAQQVKFNKDWARVAASYPDMSKADFLYSWLLVNTRCFFHTTKETEKLHRHDHMVLQPVADLLNHSPEGYCVGNFGSDFFTITTTRDHAAGEEIFIRYGTHAGDALLVEYGFSPASATNRWDETCLDRYLCPRFKAPQKAKLEEVGFWGKYMLDAETACYRTHVAIRMLVLPEDLWWAVLDGARDEDEDQALVNKELLRVLRDYEKDLLSTLAAVDKLEAGTEEMRDSLRERWLQVGDLIVKAISKLQA